MKKLRYLILLLGVVVGLAASAATPEQSLQACVAKLKGAKSIKAEFSLSSQGQTVAGTLQSKGTKFTVSSNANCTWYDGTTMTVYSPASNEVTVWKPTTGELAESNPLLYLSTASYYTVTAAAGAAKGETALQLTPKRRGSGVKSIKVVLNSSTMLPKSLDIKMGGGNVKVVVKSLQLGAAVQDATFKFPKQKYPKAKVTHL